jgi:Mg2+-importing ATPase
VTPGGPALGLSSEEAARRLAADGRNVVSEGRRRPLVLQILVRFTNPLVLLLLAAAIVAGVTGDVHSAAIILVMILLSVTLDFVQEHRAGRAAETLREAALVRAVVLRDGAPREVSVANIVAGDVVLLAAGDLVPADAQLLESRDLSVNQARLTGEPYPVPKRVVTGPAAAGISAEELGALLMGSSIVSGSARALVLRTGHRTMLGGIGSSLEREAPPSSFEQGTRAFGFLIMRLTAGMVLFAILVNAWRGRPWLDSFLFAVALAVGLTPEMLPMVVSVTLSRGGLRLGRP